MARTTAALSALALLLALSATASADDAAPAVVGAIGPNGQHANPAYCPGPTYGVYGDGETLATLAWKLGGGACADTNTYYNELSAINPQLNDGRPIVPGDKICFPPSSNTLTLSGGNGRRLLMQWWNPLSWLPWIAGVNHPDPAGCLQNLMGVAESGDTLYSIASAFHCQNVRARVVCVRACAFA